MWTLINSIIIGLLFIWLILLQIRFAKFKKMYGRLFSVSQNEPLQDVMERILRQFEKWQTDREQIFAFIDFARQDLEQTVRQSGFVRYDSFEGVGGQQSFSLLLLTPAYDGVMISALHDRVGTKLYAKQITGGTPQNNLSEEEKNLLNEALSSGTN